MKKHNLLLIWATVSYVSVVVGVPWYFLYDDVNILKYLGIFGVISSLVCLILLVLKADRPAIKSCFEKDIPIKDLFVEIAKLSIHLLKRIKDIFFQSIENGKLSTVLFMVCALLAVLVSIPAVIIIVCVVFLSAPILVCLLIVMIVIVAVLRNLKFKDGSL